MADSETVIPDPENGNPSAKLLPPEGGDNPEDAEISVKIEGEQKEGIDDASAEKSQTDKKLLEQQLADAEVKAQDNLRKAEERNRQEILDLAKKKDISACRNHKGWNSLPERYAIEAVLNIGQYKGVDLKKVQKILKNKHFNSYKDFTDTQNEIIKKLNEDD